MIRIVNLSYCINKKKILNGINIDIAPGIHGFLGPNGAGKTTLFRCLTGLYTDYTGDIKIPEISGKNMGERIGYLPQNFMLIPDLTLYDSMDYFCLLKGIKTERKHEIIKCLERVNMEKYMYKKCRELSGGMIRRAGIAQALIGAPDLVIFDEPTVGLDPEERIRFKKICAEIDTDTIVLLSTHILEDVLVCCEDILIMYNGKLIFSGNKKELIKRADKNDTKSISPEDAYLKVIADERRRSN